MVLVDVDDTIRTRRSRQPPTTSTTKTIHEDDDGTCSDDNGHRDHVRSVADDDTKKDLTTKKKNQQGKVIRGFAIGGVILLVVGVRSSIQYFNSSNGDDLPDTIHLQPVIQQQRQREQKTPKYFVLSPKMTTVDILNRSLSSSSASCYYNDKALNEESAEAWLLRSFTQDERLTTKYRTFDPAEADVFLVVGLLHLYKYTMSNGTKNYNYDDHRHSLVEKYQSVIVDPTKPHLFLIPSWNPKISKHAGIHDVLATIRDTLVDDTLLWSVGFERNPSWQGLLPPSRIVPIPYVVRMPPKTTKTGTTHRIDDDSRRINDFVFYVGDRRRNAESWAGCHRSEILEPLQRLSSTIPSRLHVKIVDKSNRMNQTEYNDKMNLADYCLIVCGDTPTSRSLTSAIVSGCIPIRIGSRLRGLCDEPCHPGFGWTVTGPQYPHLPYSEAIPWSFFPEIDEKAMMNKDNSDSTGGYDVLKRYVFQEYDLDKKTKLRQIMSDVRKGFIYGYGDPVTSYEFGDAALYIWSSFLVATGLIS